MSYWYPRLNKSGKIASGNGIIYLDGAAIPGPISGHSPQWVGDPEDSFVFIGDEARIIDTRSGQVVGQPGYIFSPRVGNTSGISAGVGHWCGWSPTLGLVYDNTVVDASAAPGAVDQRTGALCYLTPYQNDYKHVMIDGSAVRSNVIATEIVAGEECATWGEYEPSRTLYGWCPSTGAMKLSPLAPSELVFTGIPVSTPDGLWLVALTHKGLIIFPWGALEGYIHEGEFFYHHALWLNGGIRIVATGSLGQLIDFTQYLELPRTDLTRYHPTSEIPPSPHNDSPHQDSIPEPVMDHNAMNQFANEWWQENNIISRSQAMGGNATDPSTGVSYCLPLQQWAFRRIMTEAYFVKGFNWALMFWKSGLIGPEDNEITIQRKLHDVGEDVYCMLSPFEYKDAVNQMGYVTATLNFLPPFTPSTPGDESRVGPAPSLQFMIDHDLPPDGEKPEPEPIPPSNAQNFLDNWIEQNPDAQEYVTKIYYVPEGSVAPSDASHVVRLHSTTDPTNHLTVAAVTTAKGAAIAEMLLDL